MFTGPFGLERKLINNQMICLPFSMVLRNMKQTFLSTPGAKEITRFIPEKDNFKKSVMKTVSFFLNLSSENTFFLPWPTRLSVIEFRMFPPSVP